MFGSRVIFILILLCLFADSVNAGIRINEIMANPDYDEHLNEWIEIYNAGNSSIDVKDYRIGDKLMGGGKENGSGAIIPPNYFGIITDSETRAYDNFYFDENIIRLYLDGSLKLSNDGGEIVLYKSDGSEIERVDYPKVNEDESYSFLDNNWTKTSQITPGRDNENDESHIRGVLITN